MKKVFRHDGVDDEFFRMTLDSKSNCVDIDGKSASGTFSFVLQRAEFIETIVEFLKEIQYRTNPCLKYRFVEGEGEEHVTQSECPDLPPGTILRRIQAVTDFGNVRTGDFGGFLEHYGNLSQCGDSWVGDNAKVCGEVRVSGSAFVGGNACITGNVVISGNSVVSGDVKASGTAKIYGTASLVGKEEIGSSITVIN